MRKEFVKICVLCFVVSFLTSCGLNVSTSNFERCVTEGLYSAAISIYNEDIDGNAKKEAEAVSFLTDYLKEQLDNFADGDITEDEMRATMTTVENINNSLHILSDPLYAAESKWSLLLASKNSYQTGLKQLDSGDYLSALSSFRAVDSEDTENYSNAQEKYDDAKKMYLDEITEEVYADQSEENYEQALSVISQAENALGNPADLAALRADILNTWKNALIQSAKDAADSGDYISAVNILADAQNYFLDDADMIACADEICAAWTTDMIQRAKAAAESGNYEEAISELDAGAAYIDNTDIQECRSEIYESWKNAIIQQATDAAANENYSDALTEIDQGLKLFPDDSDLMTLRDSVTAQYEDYLRRTNPVSLADLEPYQQGGELVYGTDSVEDIFGNTYRTYITTDFFGSKGNGDTWRIDGIYQTFSGTIFIPSTKSSVVDYVTIYGDGIKLLDVTVRGGEDPTPFNLDVTGVRDLTVVMDGGEWGLYIGDPILTP